MNVTFTLHEARTRRGLSRAGGRRGARTTSRATGCSGGMRASLYNAMPLAGVEALIGFMREFERRHA